MISCFYQDWPTKPCQAPPPSAGWVCHAEDGSFQGRGNVSFAARSSHQTHKKLEVHQSKLLSNAMNNMPRFNRVPAVFPCVVIVLVFFAIHARAQKSTASCTDGKKNQGETDIDCGGTKCPQCPEGAKCTVNSDCSSGLCSLGVCAQAPPASSCKDGIKNGEETDTDCGGSICPTCSTGSLCNDDTDCTSDICLNGTCVEPSCSDGIKNGEETDIDCGGSICSGCFTGSLCNDDTDCTSDICLNGTCVERSCNDGRKNGDETDVDCGGSVCKRCGDGQACDANSDCPALCDNGTCVPLPDWATLSRLEECFAILPPSPAPSPIPSPSPTPVPWTADEWAFESPRQHSGCLSDGQKCGCIKIVSGTINGQTVGPLKHSVTLPAGTTNLQGEITLTTKNKGVSGWVAPLIAVRSWKSPAVGYTQVASSIATGINTYTFNINEALPTLPNGRGYLLFAFDFEFTRAQVACVTHWRCATNPNWSEDDMGFWSERVMWEAARDGRGGKGRGLPSFSTGEFNPECGGDADRTPLKYCPCDLSQPCIDDSDFNFAATAIMIRVV